MAFHTPFNQRASAKQQATPVYIGFQPVRREKRKFNWWGFNGMWLAFGSLLTAGFASPIPLLISLNGLRRPGKAMASIGTLVSLGGVVMATSIVLLISNAHHHRVHSKEVAQRNKIVKKQAKETGVLLAVAANKVKTFRKEAGDTADFDIEANMLIVEHTDPWGESLRFDATPDSGLVRSAGPDKTFNSEDDITLALSPKPKSDSRVASHTSLEHAHD
ncbi:hypothetical protein N9A76_02225 [Mariniblastus sp.]|jgi:hypothetical protein|nr:hypothetical protein [Mariniblastus sp.]